MTSLLMASMALSMMAFSLLSWSASNMAKCSLASPGIMVQLVGTDVGAMVLLSSPGSPAGLAGLENTVRFDMAGCCWDWLCWHNLYGVRKQLLVMDCLKSVYVCVWLWWFIVKHIIRVFVKF